MIFRLIKQGFLGLLNFGRSLATKYVSLNNEKCMTIAALIDLNTFKFNYYLFMIILDKCNRSCNTVDDLFLKMYFLSERKGVNVKVFNMTARLYGAKALVEHLLWDCKCKLDITACNSNQKME